MPNPQSGPHVSLAIRMPGGQGRCRVAVYTKSMVKIYEANLDGLPGVWSSRRLDTGRLSGGLYYLVAIKEGENAGRSAAMKLWISE